MSNILCWPCTSAFTTVSLLNHRLTQPNLLSDMCVTWIWISAGSCHPMSFSYGWVKIRSSMHHNIRLIQFNSIWYWADFLAGSHCFLLTGSWKECKGGYCCSFEGWCTRRLFVGKLPIIGGRPKLRCCWSYAILVPFLSICVHLSVAQPIFVSTGLSIFVLLYTLSSH